VARSLASYVFFLFDYDTKILMISTEAVFLGKRATHVCTIGHPSKAETALILLQVEREQFKISACPQQNDIALACAIPWGIVLEH